ncbi:MAG: ATP-binding protein [Bacteroidota bacterium]
MQRAVHIVIFFLTVSLPRLCAQDGPDLPKYFPAYSNDFSDYGTFPSSCFDNAYLDRHGKLWMKTCGISQLNSLHLFQFNGYEFRLVQAALQGLDHSTKIKGLYNDHALAGYVSIDSSAQVIVFDLETHELQFYPLESKGHVAEMVVTGDGEALVVVVENGDWLLYKFDNYQFALLKKLKAPFPFDFNRPNRNGNLVYQKGKAIFITTKNGGQIWHLDLRTNVSRVLSQNDFDYPGSTEYQSDVNVYLRANPSKVYIVRGRQDHSAQQLFEYRFNENRIVPVADIPSAWNSENIFWDQKGHAIYLFKDAKKQYRALLEDEKGQRFDYSAFVSELNVRIRQIKSNDFTRDLLICHEKGMTFHKVKATEAIKNFLPEISTRAIAELNDDQFLVTTQTLDQKYLIDRVSGEYDLFQNSACRLGWTNLHEDRDGFIWTHAKNLLIRYDPRTDTCEKFQVDCKAFRIFVFIDEYRLAIISNDRQLMTYDLLTRETTPFMQAGTQVSIDGHVQDILLGKNGFLWVASGEGLRKIDLINHQTELIGREASFLDHRFLCIDQDESGKLWLGTLLGGLHIYDPITKEVSVLNNDLGLPSNSVVSIVKDDKGIRWIGTHNGIALVSPEGKLIANLSEEDGLIEKECNRYSTFKTEDGKLLIGTISGLNEIDPVKTKERLRVPNLPKVYLTSLAYHDHESQENNSIYFGLNEIGTIQLPAAKRFLHLGLATSNHFQAENNRFAYRLEGIDDDWIFIGSQRNLNLNNLPSGKYRLLVKATTGFNNWTPEPLAIEIHAKEFFYKQTWFYALLAIALVGVSLLWIGRLRTAVKKATHQIKKDKELIEEQAEKLKELDVAKSRFFTNISHEFRTPLTIISGMIGQIKKKPEVWLDKGVSMIEQNTENLLHLINQILDLRKLESSELRTEMVYGDVVNYLEFVSESYQSFGQSKGIQLHFLAVQPVVLMDYDPQKMLRIISNLLSNAFKYVPENGNIYLTIDQKSKGEMPFLEIQVKDTGTGIAADRLPFIFDRFYQVDDSTTREREGTGIGLSLTKELIHLLGGTIEVASTPGKGTTFTILLPITNQAAKNQKGASEFTTEAIQEKVESETRVLAGPQTTLEQTQPAVSDDLTPSVLVVEDNPDVAQYIIACLEDRFRTEVATDGQKGIDKGIEIVPDLIISDVMMPLKDGFELCHTLKTDERTSHVPIVLLTAKSDTDSKISGWKRGADAYLTKPFEPEELISRLDNLLENRKKLQQRFANITAVSDSAGTNKPATDEFKIEDAYLQKVVRIVSENLSDQGFGIAHLCRALGMGRSQVHNKVKALTGKSTSLFVRSIRLHRARQLLQTTDMNVSEVAYEVGFRYPSHFTKFYSEEFNELPKEVK